MECECKKRRNIYKALMKAQEEFDVLEANSVNTHFKNSFAKLNVIYNATKKALRRNGIVINHGERFHPINHQQTTFTSLTHTESGEQLIDERYLVPEKPGCQGHGASETYMKRYAVKSLLGIDVGEDDDDGESERLYLARIEQLVKFIYTLPDPQEIEQAVNKKFDIPHISKLGDGKLFEAVMFVFAKVQEMKKARTRINVDNRIEHGS